MNTTTIIENATHIDADCFANPVCYMLTEEDSDRWGANAGEGCEADDCGEYRRALRRELQEYCDAIGKPVEIHVCNDDGDSWVADQLVPE